MIKGKQIVDSTIIQEKLNLTTPVLDFDAATKEYVDLNQSVEKFSTLNLEMTAEDTGVSGEAILVNIALAEQPTKGVNVYVNGILENSVTYFKDPTGTVQRAFGEEAQGDICYLSASSTFRATPSDAVDFIYLVSSIGGSSSSGGSTGGIEEAPIDGTPYSRQDASWVAASSGGSTPPAGNNTEIQFNNNGVFGSNSNLIFDGFNLKAQRIKIDNGTRITNYAEHGLSVFNATGNNSLIELIVQSETDQVLSIGEFNAPKFWFSTVASQSGHSNAWINTGLPFGIGTSSPATGLTLDIGGTGGMTVPIGTGAERVNQLATIRFNSQAEQFEIRGSLLNQQSSYQLIGEDPKDMSIAAEGTITQSGSNSQSYNLSPFKTVDGAVECKIKFIAYDTGNDFSFTGEYVALYREVGLTATLVGVQQTIYQITNDTTNPPIITLDSDGASARITVDFANTITPARSYDFYWTGTFRYNKNKASA